MDTQHIAEMLLSPDAANMQLALTLIAQQPHLARDRSVVLALVWLPRLIQDAALQAQLQVALHSYCDRRLVKQLDDSLQAIDYARNDTPVAWTTYERIWAVYEYHRAEHDALLGLHPTYLRIYEIVARYFFQRLQRIDPALRLLRFLVDRDVATEMIQTNYAYLLFHHYFPKTQQLDELDRAVYILEHAARHQLRQKDLFFNAAGYLYHTYRKDLAAAARCYQKAIESNPEHHEAAYRLAVLYMEEATFDPTRALEAIQTALQRHADDCEYLLLQATIIWVGFKDVARCETLLDALTSLHPRQPDVWNWAGKFYAQTDRPHPAEQAYKNALQLQPKHIPSLRGIVALYHQTHQAHKAELYEQQLRLLESVLW